MAQITYADKTALNVNPQVADINKVNDTDMNMIKNAVNDNETKYLLAVANTAPEQCSTGDMYFDTTDNLIYTAIATDTWSNTGVAPTENTVYVVISTNSAYVYDGNTLVSVGGQVENAYSTSQKSSYSCDYSNKAFGGTILWTNPSPSSDMAKNTELSLSSSDYDVLEIFFKDRASSSYVQSTRAYKGSNIMLNAVWNTTRLMRLLNYTNDTKYTVNACNSEGGNSASVCIPLYIIGYKTGLFN